jgi:hypothetical protein
MANVSVLPSSLAPIAKPRRLRESPPRIGRTSTDRASLDMLRLYRTNLEVRLGQPAEKSPRGGALSAQSGHPRRLVRLPGRQGVRCDVQSLSCADA